MTNKEFEAALQAVKAIPASNPGYLSVIPNTIGSLLDRRLIENIVRTALAAAEKQRMD